MTALPKPTKHYSVTGSTVYVSGSGAKVVYQKFESSRKGYAQAHETARALNRLARGLKPQYRKNRYR